MNIEVHVFFSNKNFFLDIYQGEGFCFVYKLFLYTFDYGIGKGTFGQRGERTGQAGEMLPIPNIFVFMR